MAIVDYGQPTDPLAAPSLSAWAASVFAALNPLTPQLGALTPKAGWADFGGNYAGLLATKVGRLVVVEGMLKPTADTPITPGTNYSIADLPAGFFPGRYVTGPCILGLNSFTPSTTRLVINTAGLVQITPAATGTITAASGWVSFALAFRSAT